MILQEKKQVIDTGEIGNASTGDILFDGGNKINDNFRSIYNAFGDQRLGSIADGENTQTIHATGYYQKANQYDFRTPIPTGTMYDVDASSGAVSPILSVGKAGECVVFINTNGSISVNTPLVISVSSGSFANVQGSLTITSPNSKVTCWCTSFENGVATWDYSVESLFGDKQFAVDDTISLSGVTQKIKIAHMTEFNGIKLFTMAMNSTGTKMRQSEINLMVDTIARNVHSTEFAVIRNGALDEEDEIINISFEIDANNNVNALVSSSNIGMKLLIKSISTQKLGAA